MVQRAIILIALAAAIAAPTSSGRIPLAAPNPAIRFQDPDPDPRAVLEVIATLEGWRNPRSLVHRLHNPAALVYVGQIGARRGRNGYALFDSDHEGFAAGERDLTLKFESGLELEQIVKLWSTDPDLYLAAFGADPRGRRLLDSRRRLHN